MTDKKVCGGCEYCKLVGVYDCCLPALEFLKAGGFNIELAVVSLNNKGCMHWQPEEVEGE